MSMVLRRELPEAKKLSMATHSNKKVGYKISILEGKVTHNHK